MKSLKLILFNQNGWVPVALAAGTALAGAYSAYQQGKANKEAQKQANKANAAEAQKNRDYQTEMSNTSKQREVADLRQAGLNPLLAAQGGATTPSGAMATANPEIDTSHSSVANALTSGVNTAMAATSLKKDLQQKDANIALTNMQTHASEAQRELSASTAAKNWNDLSQPERSGKHINARDVAYAQSLATQTAQNELARKRALTDQQLHQFDTLNRRVQTGLGTVGKAVDILKPTVKSGGSTTTENYNAHGEHIGTRTTRRH